MANWFDNNWENRFKVTSDNTLVDEATDKVVLSSKVHTGIPAGFWSKVKSDGADIRVTQSDGETEVAREIAHIDTGEEEVEIHFKATGLATGSDTDFYIYYNNASATEPAPDAANGRESVWTAWDFALHLSESAGSEATDSAGNHNFTYKETLPNQTDGKLGKAQNINNDKYYAETAADSNFQNIDSFSIACWVKSLGDGDNRIFAHWNFGDSDGKSFTLGQRMNDSKREIILSCRQGGTSYLAQGGELTNNVWHRVFATYDGSIMRLYVDGIQVATNSSISGTLDNRTGKFYIFNGATSLNPGVARLAIIGHQEEYQYKKGTPFSANYISTEYNNQSNANFWTVGAEEALPSVATPSIMSFGGF